MTTRKNSITSADNLMFNYVINKNLCTIKYHLTGKQEAYVNLYHDEYDNNLLHIAVNVGDISIIKFLLECHVDKYKKNIHNITPWLLAIQTHNQDIIQLFIDSHMSPYNEIKKELETVKQTFEQYKLSCKEIQNINNSELLLLRNQNKRIRDEYDELKDRNVKLNDDNKKLKTSIASLIKANKK